MTWQAYALCRVLVVTGRAEVDDWFPGAAGAIGRGHRAAAPMAATLAVCAACPVCTDCRDAALAAGEQHGVWGGINFGSWRQRGEARRGSARRAA